MRRKEKKCIITSVHDIQDQHWQPKTCRFSFFVGILVYFVFFFFLSLLASPFSGSALLKRQRRAQNLCHMVKLESNYDHFVRILMMNRWDNSCESFFCCFPFFCTLAISVSVTISLHLSQLTLSVSHLFDFRIQFKFANSLRLCNVYWCGCQLDSDCISSKTKSDK